MAESRVWGMADPRFLNYDDLMAEHKTIHRLCSEANINEPDHERFWEQGVRARSLLMLRHEMVRTAMNLRWPGAHTRSRHPTPVAYKLMQPAHKNFLVRYVHSVKTERNTYRKMPWAIQHRFQLWMHGQGFPGTQNRDRAETPWDFEGITFQEYLSKGDKKPAIKKRKRRTKQFKSGRRT